jgi:hypothetical protein
MTGLVQVGDGYFMDPMETLCDELLYSKNRALLLALKRIARKIVGIPKDFSSARFPRGVHQNLVRLCPTHPSPDAQGNL